MRPSGPRSSRQHAAATMRCDEEVESLLAHAPKRKASSQRRSAELAAQILADEPGESLVGRQIGSYRILSLLGAGGMGEVYRARDTKLGRDVAIKVVSDRFLSDPERLARFEREARVLATLNHPHIGAIYGLEEADGVRGLVLELVEGADARRASRRRVRCSFRRRSRSRGRSPTRSKPRMRRASSTAI